VVLMGPVSPQRWGPPPHARHQVLWRGRGDGDPHGAEVDPSLLRITAGDVVAAASRAAERRTAEEVEEDPTGAASAAQDR
jgi:hypothetical protein